MKSILLSFVLAVTLASVCSCDRQAADDQSAKSATNETPQAAALPDGFFLKEAPGDAVPLSKARAAAEIGESIAFTGYIGGRSAPFTDERAIFLVVDSEKAPACSGVCQTPWDACCTPTEVIAANSATVQVADVNGQTLRLSLNGHRGLVPGALVTVVGKVRANDTAFIVDASGVVIAEDRSAG